MVKAKSENNTNNSGTAYRCGRHPVFCHGENSYQGIGAFCREREAAEQPAGRCNPARRRCFLKKDRFVTVNHPTLMIYLYQQVLYKRGLFLFKEDF